MKQLGLDEYAALDSPIHRWEPRAKLIGLLALLFAFSAVRDWRLLPLMFVVTAVIFWLSHLPGSYLLTRLKLPGYFIAFLVLIVPFISGSVELLRVGPLVLHQEGLLEATAIASRFICIITLTLVLFGSAPFLTSIKAMRALGTPELLADMILLTYRYLFEIADMLSTMRTATRLRGFSGNRLGGRNLQVLASLVGTLLIRSYEQSEQVYKAMVLRGYGAVQTGPDNFVLRRNDVVQCGAAVATALLFLGANYWLVTA